MCTCVCVCLFVCSQVPPGCLVLLGDCRGLPGAGRLQRLQLGSEQGEVKVPKPPPGFPVPRLVIHSKVPCTKTVSESGKPLSCTISFLFSSSQNAVALSLRKDTGSSEQGKQRACQRPSQSELCCFIHDNLCRLAAPGDLSGMRRREGSFFYPQPFCQEKRQHLWAQVAFKTHKLSNLILFQNVPDFKQMRSNGKQAGCANGEEVLYNQH